MFPEWWYDFFFKGEIFNLGYVLDGFRRVFAFLLIGPSNDFYSSYSYSQSSLWLVLEFFRFAFRTAGIFLVVFVAVRVATMGRDRALSNLLSKRAVLLYVLSFSFILLIVLYDGSSAVNTKPVFQFATSKYILKPPISFKYVNENEARSLFNQTAPELVIASARLEQGGGSEAKVKAEVENIGAASISQQEVERRTVDLKARAKSPERMVIELVNFLSADHRLQRFDASQSPMASFEEARFMQAQKTLVSKGVVIDEKSFLRARDQLRQELLSYELARSKDVSGFALVNARFTKLDDGMLSSTYLDSSMGSIFLKLAPREYNVVKHGPSRSLTVFGAIEGSFTSKKGVEIIIAPIAIW